MRRRLFENGLLLVNLALFLAFLAGMAITGWQVANMTDSRLRPSVRRFLPAATSETSSRTSEFLMGLRRARHLLFQRAPSVENLRDPSEFLGRRGSPTSCSTCCSRVPEGLRPQSRPRLGVTPLEDADPRASRLAERVHGRRRAGVRGRLLRHRGSASRSRLHAPHTSGAVLRVECGDRVAAHQCRTINRWPDPMNSGSGRDRSLGRRSAPATRSSEPTAETTLVPVRITRAETMIAAHTVASTIAPMPRRSTALRSACRRSCRHPSSESITLSRRPS